MPVGNLWTSPQGENGRLNLARRSEGPVGLFVGGIDDRSFPTKQHRRSTVIGGAPRYFPRPGAPLAALPLWRRAAVPLLRAAATGYWLSLKFWAQRASASRSLRSFSLRYLIRSTHRLGSGSLVIGSNWACSTFPICSRTGETCCRMVLSLKGLELPPMQRQRSFTDEVPPFRRSPYSYTACASLAALEGIDPRAYPLVRGSTLNSWRRSAGFLLSRGCLRCSATLATEKKRCRPWDERSSRVASHSPNRADTGSQHFPS